MKIKFTCLRCGYTFEKNEQDVIDQHQSFRYCHCGGKLSISNLEEIVSQDISIQIKNNTSKYLSENGIEGAIELIERITESEIKKLYQDELRKRGIIK